MSKMSAFDQFKKKHGPPAQCEKAPAASVAAYAGKLPDELLAEWTETGWCAYAGGLLWTVNPDEYKDILKEWLDDATNVYAFIRTAFGSIIYWDGEAAHYLDVLFGDVSLLFHNMELNFNGVLCDDQYLDDVIRRQLFVAALPRLGAPARDECYAFQPALALGGDESADNLQRVKLRQNLALLAQLTGE
jgi:hypothetical protein